MIDAVYVSVRVFSGVVHVLWGTAGMEVRGGEHYVMGAGFGIVNDE